MRATTGSTEPQHPAELPVKRPSRGGGEATRAKPPAEPSDAASTSSSPPMSSSSGGPSKPSKKRWHKPKTVKEFAAQANEIATLVLNGEIDMETARGYASLARVVTQSVSIEVNRARILKREPDLSLE